MQDAPPPDPSTSVQELQPRMRPEDRSRFFYRPYEFALGSAGRRETRDYLESRYRFIPSPKGSEPVTREQIKKLFASESGADRRAIREAKAEQKRIARKAFSEDK